MSKKPKNPTQNLFETAESQEGLFTAKQAETAGFDKKNHSYHVRVGNWIREHRGIYRLANFPRSPFEQYVLWSLWSRNRMDKPEGIYSHQTALSLYELSDLMPAKLHMTVPKTFRRNSRPPKGLVLHLSDTTESDWQVMRGFRVMRPLRAIMELMEAGEVAEELLRQALDEAMKRGLITQAEIKSPKLPEKVRARFQDWTRKAAA